MADDSFLMNEYRECRTAIGRFDDILTRLRLQGLALVLAFNGVAALVSERRAVLDLGGLDVRLAAVVEAISTLLIVPLFFLDRLYTQYLVAAVDRARGIEGKLSKDPDLGGQPPLSQAIGSSNRKFSSTSRLHLVVYGVLAVAGIVLVILYSIAKIEKTKVSGS